MGWDGNVMEVFSFEGNGTGILGNYILANNGTGPIYKTEGDAKLGTQTLSVQSVHDTLKFPAGLITALSSEATWTLEMWVKFAAGANPNIWQIVWAVPWENSGDNTFAWLQRNDNGNYQWNVNVGRNSLNRAFAAGWAFTSLQWDSVLNQAKFFIDGVQVGNTISTALNVFNGIAVDVKIGDGQFGDTFHRDVRYDKLIISDVLRNGAETMEIAESIPKINIGKFNVSQITKGSFR